MCGIQKMDSPSHQEAHSGLRETMAYMKLAYMKL